MTATNYVAGPTPKFQRGDFVNYKRQGQEVTFRGEIFSVERSPSGKSWTYTLTDWTRIGESQLTLWK